MKKKIKNIDDVFMSKAIKMAQTGMNKNAGGPFGAIIVKDHKIIAKAFNQVTSSNDPTAHAEVVAIRKACKKLNSFQLTGCVLYTSCEPCPMCLGAIYWARPDKVYYACTRKDAAHIKFDDDFIYKELELPLNKRTIPFNNISRNQSMLVFNQWENKIDKIKY